MSVDSIISAARQILPGAFVNQSTKTQDPINSSEIDAAEPAIPRPPQDSELDAEPFEIPPPPEPFLAAMVEGNDFQPLQFPLPGNRDQFSEADREDCVEAEAAHRELGFEVFAFYVSFHAAQAEGRWGIFYRREGIRRLGLLLMRDVGVDCTEARRLAFNLLWAHERFHFRFDLGALYDELLLKTPLYNAYSKQVYGKAICTSDCFEESLANRALILFRHQNTQVSYTALDQFVRDFCGNSPPGYRDHARNPAEMKQRLLGQLRTGRIDGRVTGPEPEWLASLTRWRCPEYFITTSKFPTGRFVKIKFGGHIWTVHLSDQDPWPSKPHAHDYERRQKLSLRSGEVFSLPGRNLVQKLRPKELIFVRDELSRRLPSLELPPLAA